MNQEKLNERFKKFALRIIKLVRALPKNLEGRNIGNQIFRSGISSAANYRAACRSRSRADFIAKLGIVEEELGRPYVLDGNYYGIQNNGKRIDNAII